MLWLRVWSGVSGWAGASQPGRRRKSGHACAALSQAGLASCLPACLLAQSRCWRRLCGCTRRGSSTAARTWSTGRRACRQVRRAGRRGLGMSPTECAVLLAACLRCEHFAAAAAQCTRPLSAAPGHRQPRVTSSSVGAPLCHRAQPCLTWRWSTARSQARCTTSSTRWRVGRGLGWADASDAWFTVLFWSAHILKASRADKLKLGMPCGSEPLPDGRCVQ